ncbi:serine acetyltransferase [Bacillus sp. FJAT-47783]|uniref:serine O-acetyltransferase n=1 Tax=Bacillus sp. FJAT-47783 TaxID=2922712 RepID=UPI001FAC6532|nr:serine acetyltransferase [Bacillus sp. FJAT-47783]
MKRKIFSINAYRLYKISKMLRNKNLHPLSEFIDKFNCIIHNSFISSETDIGDKCTFAYGGIAVVIHRQAKIGKGCMIGQCVTIGSKGSTKKNDSNKPPVIGQGVYIGAGAKIIGDITIGDYCLIAPNAVVTKDVEPYSVVGGVPAKVIDKITNENHQQKYKDYYGLEAAYEN